MTRVDKLTVSLLAILCVAEVCLTSSNEDVKTRANKFVRRLHGNSDKRGVLDKTERDSNVTEPEENEETHKPSYEKLYEEMSRQQRMVQSIQSQIVHMASMQETLLEGLHHLENAVQYYHTPDLATTPTPEQMNTLKLLVDENERPTTPRTEVTEATEKVTTHPLRTAQDENEKPRTPKTEATEKVTTTHALRTAQAMGNSARQEMVDENEAPESEARGLNKHRLVAKPWKALAMAYNKRNGKIGEGKNKIVEVPQRELKKGKSKESMLGQLRDKVARNPKRGFMETHRNPGRRHNGVA